MACANQPFGDAGERKPDRASLIAETTLMPGSNPRRVNVGRRARWRLRTAGVILALSGIERRQFGANNGDSQVRRVQRQRAELVCRRESVFRGRLARQFALRRAAVLRQARLAGGRRSLGLSLAYADNSLTGNGLQDQRFSWRGTMASVYTHARYPPRTARRSFNLSARHSAGTALVFSGSVYYRDILTNTLEWRCEQRFAGSIGLSAECR